MCQVSQSRLADSTRDLATCRPMGKRDAEVAHAQELAESRRGAKGGLFRTEEELADCREVKNQAAGQTGGPEHHHSQCPKDVGEPS